MSRPLLTLGLVGLGRMGNVYAHDIATQIPGARLGAVADHDAEHARRTAERHGAARSYAEGADLIADADVDAVVIATPTGTHAELVSAAAARGRAIFCEKPLSVSLDDALRMQADVERAGVFCHVGFMRRFDAGYRAAHARLAEGTIGRPMLFKATSRDPAPPSLEFLDPAASGGLILDMGIHDIDLARWLMGPIARVRAVGAALARPEIGDIGDVDTAIVTLELASGALGVVDLSRQSTYGYDISTEILGTEGALRVGYLQETPLLTLTRDRVAHDVVPGFPERFRAAYTAQLADFVVRLGGGHPPAIPIEDGVETLRAGLAATRALREGTTVEVAGVEA